MATVALSLVRKHTEKLHPPRALHCEFPLGRPLGKPGDAAFQRSVLDAAFALLKEPEGPVLVDFPETIEDKASEPLSCKIPPRHDASLPEAVDEAMGLRSAYERNLEKTGRTLVGRTVTVDQIPDAIASFIKIGEGTDWKEAGLPGHPFPASKDVLAYYEEAAAAMVDHIPEARATESWFYQKTAAGKAMMAAKAALKEAKQPFWFYLTPMTQR